MSANRVLYHHAPFPEAAPKPADPACTARKGRCQHPLPRPCVHRPLSLSWRRHYSFASSSWILRFHPAPPTETLAPVSLVISCSERLLRTLVLSGPQDPLTPHTCIFTTSSLYTYRPHIVVCISCESTTYMCKNINYTCHTDVYILHTHIYTKHVYRYHTCIQPCLLCTDTSHKYIMCDMCVYAPCTLPTHVYAPCTLCAHTTCIYMDPIALHTSMSYVCYMLYTILCRLTCHVHHTCAHAHTERSMWPKFLQSG